MNNFYEIYKMLVSYEMFNKEGSPHLTVIGVNPMTQYNSIAVEFNYKDVWDREDRYRDVAGFYHTHPSGLNKMSQTDIDTMTQWVKCLGKNLVCIIETDEEINGWLFSKDLNGKISYQDLVINTGNDVSYDIWLDAKETFFNPVDFISNGDFFTNDEPDQMDGIEMLSNKLDGMEETQGKLAELIKRLSVVVIDLTNVLKEKKHERT